MLRISARSGEVIARAVIPEFSRPVIAANAEGFWMGPEEDSLYDSPRPVLEIYRSANASRYVLAAASDGFVISMSGPVYTMNVVVVSPSAGELARLPLGWKRLLTSTAASLRRSQLL